MPTSRASAPAVDQLEVSVLGPGVGESIVVHIGDGEWIVVDSCIGRGSRYPAALTYLQHLGVDVANNVKLVVATHAHNDHIAGLSDVVSACTNAEVVVSQALTKEEFAALVVLDDAPFHLRPRIFGEYTAVLDILRARHGGRAPLRFAVQDRPLYQRLSRIPASVIALSPSDEAIGRAIQRFIDAFPRDGDTPHQIQIQDPNEWSVALWVTVGQRHVLLGADLTRGPGDNCGWNAILSNKLRPPGRADVFKIPHHGAPNAHHDGVWRDMLSSTNAALISPFRAGRAPRPSDDDIERICNLSGRVYLASARETPPQPTSVRRDRQKLQSVASNVRRAVDDVGHVRARARAAVGEPWDVELVQHSEQLCP